MITLLVGSTVHGPIWSKWCTLKSDATHDVFKEVKGFAVLVEIHGKLSDARSMCCSHAQRFSMYHFGHGNCLAQVLSQTSMCQLLLGWVTCAELQRINFIGILLQIKMVCLGCLIEAYADTKLLAELESNRNDQRYSEDGKTIMRWYEEKVQEVLYR